MHLLLLTRECSWCCFIWAHLLAASVAESEWTIMLCMWLCVCAWVFLSVTLFHCGEEVSHLGTHGLSCKFSQGQHFHHGALNEIVHRALTAVHIPSPLEPSGISCSNGKRPDGASIVPWKSGRKILVWDVTCPDTFAPSYLHLVTNGAGEVTAAAESKFIRPAIIAILIATASIALETMGAPSPKTWTFLQELGRRLRRCQLDDLACSC